MLRIILMCFIIVITILPLIVVAQSLMFSPQSRDFSMIIPFLVFGCAIGSILFHLEVLRQKKKPTIGRKKVKLVYWILNVLIGLCFLFFGLFFLKEISDSPGINVQRTRMGYVVFLVITLLGVFNLLDMFFVYNLFTKDKSPTILSEIDKIGDKEES